MRLRSRDEKGAAAVEAAIVTPVVLLMLFGIIEFGMLFKDYLGTQAMLRAGVRLGSAEPRLGGFAQNVADQVQATGTVVRPQDVEELWVYKANVSNDFPDTFTDFSSCTTCVKFTWDAGTGKFRASTTPTWTAASQNACARSTANPAGPDRIGVFLKVKHNPITGIFAPVKISEGAALYLEPSPALQGCKP
jgi:Flp pilus assembly protein TadG